MSTLVERLEALAVRVEKLLTDWGDMEEAEERDAIARDIRALRATGEGERLLRCVMEDYAKHGYVTAAVLDEITTTLAAAPTPSEPLRDEPRFFIAHDMVHDRKTGKHVGDDAQGLLTLLQRLENERDAWRMTANAYAASQRVEAEPLRDEVIEPGSDRDWCRSDDEPPGSLNSPEGLTSKEAWWAGARVGLNVSADMPRTEVAARLGQTRKPLRDAGAVATDEMVTAYLTAQRAAIAEYHSKWNQSPHQDDIREACRRGLNAALAAHPAPQQPAITDAMVGRAYRAWRIAAIARVGNREAVRAALTAAQAQP